MSQNIASIIFTCWLILYSLFKLSTFAFANFSIIFSRQAGHRFGEHIERVMPLIVQYSREEDDELREYCLQAFEAFVHRCPKEITPHINTVRLVTLLI